MKRKKNLLALVLALMMAFSLMAVPAAASMPEDKDIVPLGIAHRCTEPDCSGTVFTHTESRSYDYDTVCKDCSYKHRHRMWYSVDVEACDSCSYRNETYYNYHSICAHG